MSRATIANSAADCIAQASAEPPPPALVGFDGFIDSIVHMVETRRDMTASGYDRFRTIGAFSSRCAAAAGKSTNIEQVLIERRFGGNGPLMAGALAALEVSTTFIGAISDDADPTAVHPAFVGFAERCERVVPLCPPSSTLCMEFDDGKLMFNETGAVQRVTWDLIKQRVGLDELVRIVGRSRLLGIVNWSLLGGVPGIWDGLVREVLPRIDASDRRIFIDLSDPAKRTDDDIREALTQLRKLEEFTGIRVTLGLNLSEVQRVDAVIGSRAFHGVLGSPTGLSLARGTALIREKLGLSTVVVHPREGAAAADRDAPESSRGCWFDGPFTSSPQLSTGAGDHFNAGYAFAQVRGLSVPECLATACAVSGAYVRDAQSPSLERLLSFLRDLPPVRS